MSKDYTYRVAIYGIPTEVEKLEVVRRTPHQIVFKFNGHLVERREGINTQVSKHFDNEADAVSFFRRYLIEHINHAESTLFKARKALNKLDPVVSK